MSEIVLKTRVLLAGAIAVVALACAGAAFGEYSGGLGTEAEPYRIGSVADWQELMETDPDWDKHFVLIADVDMNGVAMTPVGNDANGFTGVIDGNDHIIRNADVNMPGSDYVGLFGYLDSRNAQIRNLGVQNVSIFGRDYVGGLVGYKYGIVSNCYSTGSVDGTGNCVGGLAGVNVRPISNCWSAAFVNGNSRVGGLAGVNVSDIANCYSTGSVTGRWDVGGLVGLTDYYAIISECYSTGSVSGDECVGGLIGCNNYGIIISKSYSTGSVNGGFYIGGLVGWNERDVTITTCYATGCVNGDDLVGGLVGSNFYECTISNCYSTGSVTSAGLAAGLLASNGHFSLVGQCYSTGSVASARGGGLVGWNDPHGGWVGASFWDVNTSGWTTSDGGMPKTTAEMKTQSTFSSAGWDFIEVWDIGENQTYPFLRVYAAGDINHDGVVDFRDLAHLGQRWLSSVE